MARREQYIVGLDVGTSTVICVIGESLEDGGLNVVGIGVSESRGIKRGVVVNLEAAVESIKKAIEEEALALRGEYGYEKKTNSKRLHKQKMHHPSVAEDTTIGRRERR